MAKFSRFLFGGVVGAGLAYLFSRKDVRRRLLGGGHPLLPAAPDPYAGMSPAVTPAPASSVPEHGNAVVAVESDVAAVESDVAAVAATDVDTTAELVARQAAVESEAPVNEIDLVVEAPVTKAGQVVEEPVAEAGQIEEAAAAEKTVALDLDARIEETRRQVEEQLEEPFTAAAEKPVEEPFVEEESAAEEPPESVQIEKVEDVDELATLSTPVEGEPTLETEPAAEAATEPPGGPAPSEINREEMRQRIDETRARLKAKAFDAMVSGESFIEPEASEEGVNRKPDTDASIDKDLEDQIDRSLREED